MDIRLVILAAGLGVVSAVDDHFEWGHDRCAERRMAVRIWIDGIASCKAVRRGERRKAVWSVAIARVGLEEVIKNG